MVYLGRGSRMITAYVIVVLAVLFTNPVISQETCTQASKTTDYEEVLPCIELDQCNDLTALFSDNSSDHCSIPCCNPFDPKQLCMASDPVYPNPMTTLECYADNNRLIHFNKPSFTACNCNNACTRTVTMVDYYTLLNEHTLDKCLWTSDSVAHPDYLPIWKDHCRGSCDLGDHYCHADSATIVNYEFSCGMLPCDRWFTEASGVIESPNYPSNYPNNLDCTYTIHTAPGSTITISFTDYRLENAVSGSCAYDRLEIYDGTTTTIHCGNSDPADVTSTGNILSLRLVTDFGVRKFGFQVTYTTSPSATGTIVLPPAGPVCFPYPNMDTAIDNLPLTSSQLNAYNIPILCRGEVVAWRFYAVATGRFIVAIFKPYSGGFLLVARNAIFVNTLGDQIRTFNKGARVPVDVGYVYGVYYNETTDTPIIPHADTSNPGPFSAGSPVFMSSYRENLDAQSFTGKPLVITTSGADSVPALIPIIKGVETFSFSMDEDFTSCSCQGFCGTTAK